MNAKSNSVNANLNFSCVELNFSNVELSFRNAKLSFRKAICGKNAAYGSSGDCSNIICTSDCYVYGNIMSLIAGLDNSGNVSGAFSTAKTLTSDYTFKRLFYGNKKIKNNTTKNLELPATTLTNFCYQAMFRGCTSLTAAPALPATNLAVSCYQSMFSSCTSLVNAPDLPATNLAVSCYQFMFSSCTSLQNAPALPATTLAPSCYQGMFQGCAKLVNAPELRAPTLAQAGYTLMFSGCSSLYNMVCLATDISADGTNNWLKGVHSGGTFTKASSMSGWTTGVSGIPKGWTVQDY